MLVIPKLVGTGAADYQDINTAFTEIEKYGYTDAAAFNLFYAITQALIRDLDSRLAIAEAELATIP